MGGGHLGARANSGVSRMLWLASHLLPWVSRTAQVLKDDTLLAWVSRLTYVLTYIYASPVCFASLGWKHIESLPEHAENSIEFFYWLPIIIKIR